MPAPKNPNTAPATAGKIRAALDRKAAALRAAGWTVEAPGESKGWDLAVDWLLTSRHTADPDIQDPFWACVDGLITRDELETFTAEDVRRRREERGLDPDTGQERSR
jgi:hypothetical protein